MTHLVSGGVAAASAPVIPTLRLMWSIVYGGPASGDFRKFDRFGRGTRDRGGPWAPVGSACGQIARPEAAIGVAARS